MTPIFTTHYVTCVLDRAWVSEEFQNTVLAFDGYDVVQNSLFSQTSALQKVSKPHMTKVKDPHSCGLQRENVPQLLRTS